VIRTLGYTGWQLDPGAYPRLTAWYGRVCARDAWKAAVAVEEGIFKGLGI
jgi:glutathione S-transferase